MSQFVKESVAATNANVEIQKCGLVYKLPWSGKAKAWKRRYFVVKDGYMMYYEEDAEDYDGEDDQIDVYLADASDCNTEQDEQESQIYLDAKVLDIATKSWQPSIMKDFNAQLPRMCG